MMAANRPGAARSYDDHPSLSASLEDFEQSPRSPAFDLPSQHSGFKSEPSESEDDPVSEEPWEPPAWRNQKSGGGWYRHQPYLQDHNLLKTSVSASRSRGTSPRHGSAQREEEDITLAAKIPLPRGSVSPVKERSPSNSPGQDTKPSSPSPHPEIGQEFGEKEEASVVPENNNNCVLSSPRYVWISTNGFKTFALLYAQKSSNVRSP